MSVLSVDIPLYIWVLFDGQNGHVFSCACALQIIGICEIIKKGDIMQDKNQILLFDWEKDIMKNLPDCYIWHGESNDCLFCPPRNPMITSSLFIQADPKDYFVFYEAIAGKRIYRVTKEMWRYTIDTYLFHYYQVAQQRDNHAEIRVLLSADLDGTYRNYVANSVNSKKQFFAKLEYFEPVEDSLSQPYFKTPKFTSAAYLNILFRTLFCRSNSYKQQNTFYYDGLLVRNAEARELLSRFSIEDYIEHEYQTAISLSIEITAVLLEFPEKELALKALDVFADKLLPRTVESPLIFTRNAAARSFFQQILMELGIQRYRWYDKEAPLHFSDSEWKEMIERAMMHYNVLAPPIYTIPVPKEQQQETLAHLKELLAMLKKPVNIVEYVDNPIYGLAAFCVPEHPNVSFFLKKLNEALKEESFEIPRCKGDKHELFAKVHQKVLHALHPSQKGTDH